MARTIGVGDFKTTPKMEENIKQVLDNCRLSYGPFSKKFEHRFASLHNCEYGILSNSGTSSLLVALQTLKELHGWRDGDEVIVPAITFVATVNVVLHLRLKPVLVDVEKDYYGIDVQKAIDTAFTDETKCIIPVHTFGMPCNISDVVRLKEYFRNIKIIEDSCESMFVAHLNHSIGSWGDIACFSTYMAHLITTGIGGIATTNNPDYARKMRSLVNHGMAIEDLGDDLRLSRGFVFDSIGHSFRVSELEAALGLAQLENYEEMMHMRLVNACYLASGLEDYQEFLQLPAIRPNTEHAFMVYPIVCKQDGIRDKLRQHLHKNGIGTRLMLPLINQPCYKGMWEPKDYPIAKWIDENGYYIGCHQHLTQDDLDKIIKVHIDFFHG